MSDKLAHIHNRLQKLTEAFNSALPERLNDIETLWLKINHQQFANKDDITQLHHALHKLAGTAGIFRQDELGQQARQCEQNIICFLHNNIPTHEQINILNTRLVNLRKSII